MEINTKTKIIARMHADENGTGLNIYNPYFQDQNLNAVYLLFQNKNPKPLVEGVRKLNLSGAITAGFEHDPRIPKLVDKRTTAVKLAQRVGIITNKKGVLTAHYQGGEGLLSAIEEKIKTKNKRVVIVGAGTVAKTLSLALESSKQKPKEIYIYNRSKKNAQSLKTRFKLVRFAGNLNELHDAEGDLLVNASRIGSIAPDEVFNGELIKRFSSVADVTFGTESTNLITNAKKQKKLVISGWDMFTHQAAVVLSEILGHNANINRLRYFVRKGLSSTNHGAAPKKN